MIPWRTPAFLPFLYPFCIWRIPVADKRIFLTFDDGPIEGPTEYVLGILKKYEAQATFFCIGDNVRKYPHIFKRILAEGHRVGNHTFNHLSAWKTQRSAWLSNIEQCEKVMAENATTETSRDPRLFRPPYGRLGGGAKRDLSALKVIMWDVLTHDYDNSINPERCLRNSIEATRPGSIVVFHDSIKAERNMTFVLPRYIEHFKSQGYQFNAIVL